MEVYFDNGIFAIIPPQSAPECDLGQLDPIPGNLHLTLISPKSCSAHRKRLKLLDWSTFQTPPPQFGPPAVCKDDTGRISMVAPIINQDEFASFVKQVAEFAQVDIDPNRFFHLSLANNGGGNPHNSIGRITREHFPSLGSRLASRRSEQASEPSAPSI